MAAVAGNQRQLRVALLFGGTIEAEEERDAKLALIAGDRGHQRNAFP